MSSTVRTVLCVLFVPFMERFAQTGNSAEKWGGYSKISNRGHCNGACGWSGVTGAPCRGAPAGSARGRFGGGATHNLRIRVWRMGDIGGTPSAGTRVSIRFLARLIEG